MRDKSEASFTVAGTDRGTPERATAASSGAHDFDGELSRWPLVQAALVYCPGNLKDVYDAADEKALSIQQQHRRIVRRAAVFGTFAVILAITTPYVAPGPDKHPFWLFLFWLFLVFEAASAVLALVAVVVGLVRYPRDHWLLERHKAERCRLLNFRFLVDPALWGGGDAESKALAERFCLHVDEIESLTPQAMYRWAEDDRECAVPALPGTMYGDESDAVRQLVSYYRERRLSDQQQYFADRAAESFFWDRLTRNLPAALFFASVFCALVHFLAEVLTKTQKWPEYGPPFLYLAAVLPVVGAGIQTWRAAHEFARNSSRFEAKRAALTRLAQRLDEAKGLQAKFVIMWQCEHVLESDHREWLRLMLEAEWYG